MGRPKAPLTFTVEGDCWIWTGRTRGGYGVRGRDLAHRSVYEERVGPIPDGLELDHLCRTPLCVNPAHLEPVTREENMRRRVAAYTHCKSGHEFTELNTYIPPSGDRRDCRTCIRARVRKYTAKRRAS